MMKVWHRTQMYVQKLFHNRDMLFYSHLSQFLINKLPVQSVDLTIQMKADRRIFNVALVGFKIVKMKI